MDLRGKIIDKYSIEVLDIEILKEDLKFQFQQATSAMKITEERIVYLNKCEELNQVESDELTVYNNLLSQLNTEISKYDSLHIFTMNEMPEVGECDSALPYYEIENNIIIQKWEVEYNEKGKISNTVADLKREIKEGDYKVIKCYEASLVGEPLPYDVQTLHVARQQIRDDINRLQLLLPI